MMVEKALKTCADMAEYFAKELVIAVTIEQALKDGGITEWPSEAGFSISHPYFSVSLYGKLQGDRDFRTALRRALGVPTMERAFNKNGGTFEYVGISTTLRVDDVALRLVIRAGADGCTLKAVKETVEITRFEADCTPAAEEATP